MIWRIPKHYYSLLLSLVVIILLCAALFFWYATHQHPQHQHPQRWKPNEHPIGGEQITPLPLEVKLNPDRVALGMRLFHDQRLSSDNTVSCANCHNLAHAGADITSHSRGVAGHEGAVNAPTVFNSGFNFRQFWDGRAETLEDQIDGPINDPQEMASSWSQVQNKLKLDSDYPKLFAALYPGGITPDNIKETLIKSSEQQVGAL